MSYQDQVNDVFADFHNCRHDDIAWEDSSAVGASGGWLYPWATVVAVPHDPSNPFEDHRFGVCTQCGATMAQDRGRLPDGTFFKGRPFELDIRID